MFTRRWMLGATAGAAALGALPRFARAAAFAEPAALAGDIAILRQAYEALHPGLYRYATADAMAARFDVLAKDFAASASQAEAYLILSRFLASIRCGHTYANFYNQSDAVAATLFAGRTRLPFAFRWLEDAMVVTGDLTADKALPPGTVIAAIDGRPVAEILAALLPYARADGGNDGKRRAQMEVQGFDRFETFDIFQGLLFPPGDGGFRLLLANGETRVVAAIDLAARQGAMTTADPAENAPLWRLDMLAEGVAHLVMPNWALYDSTWDWEGFLARTFRQIEKAPALVIDLRGNEGGLDCGNRIIARLIDKPIAFAADERRVRYRRTPPALDPFLDTWDDSFRDWGADAEDIGGGFYRLRGKEEDGNAIAPLGPRYRGKVIVLVDAVNSSATFQFTQAVQDNGRGRLFGGATGGDRRGINGGAFFFLRLPASGLEADVPLIGRFPLAPQPDAPLFPDIPATVTAAGIAAGRDEVLETALAALRG